ncbi:MAG: hypothetical protein V2B14_02040 [bacterium]
MEKKVILGILLANRVDEASKFQEIITKYGCNIKTRIGLHNTGNNKCSSEGIILLEIIGDDNDIENLENEIKTIINAQVQKMVFSTGI